MNVLILSSKVWPLNSGEALHTFGFCDQLSNISNLYIISYIEKNDNENCRTIKNAKNCIYIKPTEKHLMDYYYRFVMLSPINYEFLQNAINCIKQNNINCVIIDHIKVAAYFQKIKNKFPNIIYIYNSHNVEYINLLENYQYKKFIFGKIRCQLLRLYEKKLVLKCDNILSISQSDIKCFKKMYINCNKYYLNKPLIKFRLVKKESDFQNKFNKKLLIVGSMSWYPNVKGILWFVNNVFNKLITNDNEYKLYLVGNAPSRSIQNLAIKFSNNIIVTGRVENLEQYFKLCDLSIIPIFEGTGVKIKVLESIGRGIPTITTSFAAKDYNLKNEVIIADSKEKFLESIINIDKFNKRIKLYKNMKTYYHNYMKFDNRLYDLFQ